MRSFTPFEENNIKFLVNHNVTFTQVQLTATGLSKSIMDATAPMRAYFKENNVHDYEHQGQGPDKKVMIDTFILTQYEQIKTQTSLYRPVTKDGDPRLWVYKLNKYTDADDIHAIIAYNPNELYVINLTRVDISAAYNSILDTPIKSIISYVELSSRKIAEELLFELMKYQDQWINAGICADTGIGRKIETLLGINMNASREPDYKGIELKSYRDRLFSAKCLIGI